MNSVSFEEILEREGKLVYTSVGTSMLPLIKEGRDILVIEKPVGRLKKYDVPLYKRQDGRYVLHRILKVRKDDYVICGDNLFSKEYGVTDQMIIGVLSKIVRGGKEVPLSGFKYRFYLFFRCKLFPIRAFILHVKSKLKRLKKA